MYRTLIAGVVVVGCASDPPPPIASRNAPTPVSNQTTPDGRALVPPTMLERFRIAGDKMIAPSAASKTEMATSGLMKVVAKFSFCVSEAGTVTDVARVQSSGLASYDATLEHALHEWRYRPYDTSGSPQAVCTHIAFIYSRN